MSGGQDYKFLLVEGEEEAVVGVIERTLYPNEKGNTLPPMTLEYCDRTYTISREFMPRFYVYTLDESAACGDIFD